MDSNQDIKQLVDTLEAIARALLDRKALLACAESCTGGWISKVITDRAGSSAWFDRGFVTYSNAAKQDMLGVSDRTLQQQGAVSEAVVREMAQGALSHSTAAYAIAVSGIAGPGGGSVDKPVGTVWLAWADSEVVAECFHFHGDRDRVRAQAVEQALAGLLRRLSQPFP